MKLTILGGGGVRMPAFVRAVLARPESAFSEICLFEPDEVRRATTGRLAVEIAAALGQRDVVTLTADPEQACTDADYVFSAIRVGGDRGRVIDEQIALQRGIVGQETTGPGGGAMALRTIPVVLSYCELLSRLSPGAVLINFTNPAGLITQAMNAQGLVTAIGVCDTPAGVIADIVGFVDSTGLARTDEWRAGYAGLNHLGWVCSFVADGQELIGDLLARFDELQRFGHAFGAFDAGLVRRVGAIPTEYLYYYYDSRRYLDSVARAGSSRGQDVMALNQELLAAISAAFSEGGVQAAWSAYSRLLGVRRDTYMRTDTEGASRQDAARAARFGRAVPAIGEATLGGYESLALRVIDGLAGKQPGEMIVNIPNDGCLNFLDPDDIVEVAAAVNQAGVRPLPAPELPKFAQALVLAVKEYERGIVSAALTGDAGLAAEALAEHPLVPGITAARELLADYIESHGEHLAYLR